MPIQDIEHRVTTFRLEEDSQPLHGIDLACAGFKDASEAQTHLKSLTGLQRLNLRSLALDNQPLKGRLDLRALPGLTHLYLQNTAVREVDVSGLKDLQFVDVSGCKSLDLAFLAQLPDTCKVYLGGTWGMTTCADLKEHTDFFVKIAEDRVTAYTKGKGKKEIDLTNFGLKKLPQSLHQLFEKEAAYTKVCVSLCGNTKIEGAELYDVFRKYERALIDVERLDLTKSDIDLRRIFDVSRVLNALVRMDIPLHLTSEQYSANTRASLNRITAQLPKIVVAGEQTDSSTPGKQQSYDINQSSVEESSLQPSGRRNVMFGGGTIYYVDTLHTGVPGRSWRRTDEESRLRADEVTVASSPPSSSPQDVALLVGGDESASLTSTVSVPSHHPHEKGGENGSFSRTESDTQSSYSIALTVNNDKRVSTEDSLMQRQFIGQQQLPDQFSSLSIDGHAVDNQGKYVKPENPQSQSRFGSLPPELQLQIFKQLPGEDLVRMQQACQRFERISEEVLEGNSDGAREARKEARKSVDMAITELAFFADSPATLKEKLENLISQHRDIGVEMCWNWISYGFNPEKVDILLSVLVKQTHIRSLKVSEDKFPSKVESIIRTLKVVSGNCNLTELHVAISSEVTPAQAESLAGIQSLTSIRLSPYCSLLGYSTLQVLLANPSTTLISFGAGYGQERCSELALVKQALTDNKTIEELHISHATDGALAAIASALETHKSLDTLMFPDGEFKSHGLQILGTALEHNTRLTSLSMRCCYIDDAGITAFAPMLENNKTLRSLDITGNIFQFEGVQALARSLKHNTTLTELDLSNNQIGSNGIEAIAEAALNMKNLTRLTLDFVGGKGGRALEALRASNHSLEIRVNGW